MLVPLCPGHITATIKNHFSDVFLRAVFIWGEGKDVSGESGNLRRENHVSFVNKPITKQLLKTLIIMAFIY